ncbi:hypothetical protein Nm8I071_56700 [Nonomuraea sp. TT08I-71]|nr:hypothetical protein Nm8I071_56700 [Nonomuraea sp. TT08I-71]
MPAVGPQQDGRVLHYDPETEDGWFNVPRREGVDLDTHPGAKAHNDQRPAAG